MPHQAPALQRYAVRTSVLHETPPCSLKFPLCLSRACLGKTILFVSINWYRKRYDAFSYLHPPQELWVLLCRLWRDTERARVSCNAHKQQNRSLLRRLACQDRLGTNSRSGIRPKKGRPQRGDQMRKRFCLAPISSIIPSMRSVGVLLSSSGENTVGAQRG